MSSADDTRGPGPDPFPAGQWLEMVRREERRGELLAAYDIANRGLEQHPEDVELAYRAVLALARTGSTSEAERRFVELHLTDVGTEDVAALRARILKDRALAASGEERRHLAEAAALAYRRIADQNRAYFPAINAATLHLVAGDAATARTLARESLSLVEASGEASSYYAAATRAEAGLLLGDPGSAHAELTAAAGLHEGDFGAVSTTRRQLRMICGLTGVDEGILSALAGPAVAHYCGHMISGDDGNDGLRNFDEDAVRKDIEATIARNPVGFAYGSLASGADILWAEALLASGAELHVVLPFALEDFLATSVAPSGGAWVRRFHECLEQSVSVTYATEGRFLGDEILFGYCARLAMGLALLRARFLDARVFQLALWDGQLPAGEVGTAMEVATWGATGHDATMVTPVMVGPPRHRAGPAGPAPARHDARVVRAILTGDIRGYSKLVRRAAAGLLPGGHGIVLRRARSLRRGDRVPQHLGRRHPGGGVGCARGRPLRTGPAGRDDDRRSGGLRAAGPSGLPDLGAHRTGVRHDGSGAAHPLLHGDAHQPHGTHRAGHTAGGGLRDRAVRRGTRACRLHRPAL